MGRSRVSWPVVLFAGLAAFYAGPAVAQSDICMRLEARLMALDSRAGGGNSHEERAYERSINNQRAELDRATAEARRAGCMGAFFRRLRSGADCGSVMATIDRMRANLNRMEAARDRSAADPFGGGSERDELVRALAANRCGGQYDDFDRRLARRGFFASLFGGGLFRERGWGRNYFDESGTYRTLCVRSCDGYYFPISFATVRARFARDEQLCRSMCPGTDVALYIHRNPGQESDAMVSLAGEPYTILPTAFRYRQKYDPACRCGRMTVPRDLPVDAFDDPAPRESDPWGFARAAEASRPAAGPAPIPLARPAAGEDPETLANRAGSLAPETVMQPKAAVAGLGVDGERSIRVVGPAFYYGQ